MSEQINEGQGAEEQNKEQEREYSPIELEAMDQGWRPKEEFQGDPDRFIEAGEFIRRGELFAKIDHQNKEIKQVRQTLEQFKSHHANVEKAAYDRAIADLKRQRKEALAEGDVDRFDALDEQVDKAIDARDEFVKQASQPAQQVPTVHPDFAAWAAKNPWYSNDPIMQGAADRFGKVLASQGLSPLEVLKQVETKIKEEFPHKFSNPKRNAPSAVESPSARGVSAKASYQPNDIERQVAKNFVRAGLYKTEKEYYAELAKMNEKD